LRNRYTYEVAPVFSLLEREVLERCLALVGYPPMPEADGVISPGGSLSNMYGIVLARYRRFPQVKSRGLGGLPALGLFTSEDGHYSITKGAHWLGIGTDNIFKVGLCTLPSFLSSYLRSCTALRIASPPNLSILLP
jgi:glutamate/tyrosine decarboxylase-like PLP-dependent enzyme